MAFSYPPSQFIETKKVPAVMERLLFKFGWQRHETDTIYYTKPGDTNSDALYMEWHEAIAYECARLLMVGLDDI